MFDEINDIHEEEDKTCEKIETPPKADRVKKRNSLSAVFERDINVLQNEEEKTQAKVIDLKGL